MPTRQFNSWWQPVAHPTNNGFEFWVPAFHPLICHRVAQAAQGISASTDETTSHSTKQLANDTSQVAGYV